MEKTRRKKAVIPIKREKEDNNRPEIKNEICASDKAKNSPITSDTRTKSSVSSNKPLVEDTTKIKQEDPGTPLLKKLQNSSSSRSPTYYCRLCKLNMPNIMSVFEHRTQIHGGRRYSSSALTKHLDLIPDILDPNYYCRSCQKTLSSKRSYRKHLSQIHCMNLRQSNLVLNNNVLPDPNDPNYCCSPCKKQYTNNKEYRKHLRSVHKMKLAKLLARLQRPRKNPDVLPDWHNPNKYCKSCERFYASKLSFQAHCKNYHHMESPKVKRPNLNDPNFNCSVCNITFINKTHLKKHCKYFHPSKQKVPSTNVVPDISDPNNYCKSCEKYLCDKESYREHLQYTHRILGPPSLPIIQATSTPVNEIVSKFLCYECGTIFANRHNFKTHFLLCHTKFQTKKTAEELPDEDNPHLKCRICKTTYSTRASYRYHLRKKHWMKLKPLIALHYNDSKVLPDPFNLNLHCRTCDLTFNSLLNYQQHCKRFHKMTWSSIAYPDAQIDTDSVNFYCAKCDKHLATKTSFSYHLTHVHNLDAVTTY